MRRVMHIQTKKYQDNMLNFDLSKRSHHYPVISHTRKAEKFLGLKEVIGPVLFFTLLYVFAVLILSL